MFDQSLHPKKPSPLPAASRSVALRITRPVRLHSGRAGRTVSLASAETGSCAHVHLHLGPRAAAAVGSGSRSCRNDVEIENLVHLEETNRVRFSRRKTGGSCSRGRAVSVGGG